MENVQHFLSVLFFNIKNTNAKIHASVRDVANAEL